MWEVLDGGLKSKIEIQWSEITALKATCPENGPGTLDVVVSYSYLPLVFEFLDALFPFLMSSCLFRLVG